MTDPNTQPVSDKTDKTPEPYRPKWIRRILTAVVVLTLIAGSLVVAQSMLAPEVEDDKTVQIQKGSQPPKDSDAPPSDQAGPQKLTDTVTMELVEAAKHPLDPLMELADSGLKLIDEKYSNYSAKMLSQVRTGNTLHEENLMLLKIRHEGEVEISGEPTKVPFGVYTRFLKPKAKVGQEAIWVRGKNGGKILGHGTDYMDLRQ